MFLGLAPRLFGTKSSHTFNKLDHFVIVNIFLAGFEMVKLTKRLSNLTQKSFIESTPSLIFKAWWQNMQHAG